MAYNGVCYGGAWLARNPCRIVHLFWFDSGSVLITGDFIEVSPFLSGVVALSLIFASYASQTLRGALKAVGRGQREAASALGISQFHAFVRIVLHKPCDMRFLA